MHKTENKTRTITTTTHHFYCDDCGAYLGSSEEYDDGYYDERGAFGLSFNLNSNWYHVNKIFCDKCKQNYLIEVKEALENLGFVYRKYN